MPAQLNALCQIPRLYLAWNMVKAKGSVGGIDGMTIIEFEKEKRKEIPKLAEEIKSGAWKPQPYMEIEVAKTKNSDEIRKLGMTAIRDKIVQHAIKSIIELRYEKIFLGCSYGYRPGKGATKAIRRVLAECSKKQYKYVLRLDIDNFFDTIDHEILQKRLIATGTEAEIVRLIMLCVKMGKVKQNSLEWVETEYGTPQGAVLSPILSNLYLHSFDQFAVSKNVPYVRYADDFLFLTETKEQAKELLSKTEAHLKEKLKLSLNQPPEIIDLNDGFDFLGITVKDKKLLKYFNKYHKSHYPHLKSKMEMMEKVVEDFKRWKKTAKFADENFLQKLLGHEAQVAIRYWDYIRELFSDDNVKFEQREHQGARDLVNSMLNYGYAILYVRIWQALLAAKLNPFESLIHVQREGKPALVYDMIEIFRSQVVDRVVISLVQKGQNLEVRNGLLTDTTRQLLVKSVMERLARYEKYQGEEIKMEQIILRQAKLLAKAFEGTDKFKPYVAKW